MNPIILPIYFNNSELEEQNKKLKELGLPEKEIKSTDCNIKNLTFYEISIIYSCNDGTVIISNSEEYITPLLYKDTKKLIDTAKGIINTINSNEYYVQNNKGEFIPVQ